MKKTKCKHKWKKHDTPMDAYTPWRQCSKCDVIGRVTKSAWGDITRNIVPYKCSLPKCSELAVKQLSGRDSHCCYIWRCKDHVDVE